MKFITIIAALFLMAGCASHSGNPSVINIDGTWTGEYKSGRVNQSRHLIFNFKKVGDSIKGTVGGGPGQWLHLENIEIKGKKITFSVTLEMYGVLNYKGKIKGEKIKMSYKSDMTDGFGGMGMDPLITTTGSIGGKGPGGGFGGGMGGMVGMGGVFWNKFTLERVSNEPQNPVE